MRGVGKPGQMHRVALKKSKVGSSCGQATAAARRQGSIASDEASCPRACVTCSQRTDLVCWPPTILPALLCSALPAAPAPAQDPRVERLPCTHKGTYADDCICERVKQHRCYIVATCDRDLRRRIRKIPGVPIMYIHSHKYSIERLPEATMGGAPRT